MHSGNHRKEIRGAERRTTNNRMELKAAIEALSALKQSSSVDVYTDSQYVRRGITEWLPGWKRRGWRTASRAPVKNEDLWRQLDDISGRHEVRWHWVRGHSGHRENERADELANIAIDELMAAKRP